MAISYAKVSKTRYIFRQLTDLTREEFEKIEYFREKGVYIPIVSVPPKVSKSIVVPPSFYDGNVVLIDDKEKNVIEWNNAGGIGVLFTDADVSDNLTSVKSLEFLKKIK